jgi:hypothetical protein
MKKRKRTEKSKYKHESTGEHCTAAAYVAEIMCKRNAENRNEGSLPYKFWNTKKWKWTYQRQVIAANKMIEQFGERALVRAVNSPEFNGIFSLNHPKCSSIIRRYQLLLIEEEKNRQEIEVKVNPKRRNKGYGKKNLLSKLRQYENGEKEIEDDG